MRFLFLALSLLPAVARADVPAVAVDIAPVHSLVSRVMQGVGTPDLVIPAGASPHGYAMRPSEARSLSGADLVVWVGAGLTPWLADPIEALAPNAEKLALMDAQGMSLLGFREGAGFGEAGHDHGHGHDDHGHDDKDHEGHDDHAHEDKDHEGHDDHAHEDKDHEGHDDHAHEDKDHEGHDDHAHEDKDHEGHDDHGHEGHAHHGDGQDPHIWLDPANAAVALDAIAKALAALDPGNAPTYLENAQQGQAELAELTQELTSQLSEAKGRPFIVFHDAYHYFEARFGTEAVAAVSAGDAATPGPARISALRAQVTEAAPVCAFAEPQMNTALLQTVFEGQDTKLAMLDPLGATLTPGPDLYGEMIRGIATSMAECLNP
ncbi:zinc ABC transporter substrate-binding protein [Sulfitobacter pacificus]|uniref:High-affinity zinc uptake system protein ZnuA n=2 Tax=Sulfitobacter pacificus TaxID=1499314 RepID=A0ABQ5VGT0_9RHOB|nr:zinc ABC transporter substrate-binding protein [Sulfitobacter pacificus]GLQ26277.1 hypothetical protein GCM10007927_10800 [Sulfitobacter pacificus]